MITGNQNVKIVLNPRVHSKNLGDMQGHQNITRIPGRRAQRDGNDQGKICLVF